MEKVRDVRYDTLKGILILGVLYRHFIINNATTMTVVNEVVANFIHFFTMPLFVFISGYFTRHVSETKKYWSGIVGILETYLFFQIVKGFLYGYTLGEIPVRPAPMMWYLLALAFWRILYYIFNKCGLKINGSLIIILLIITMTAGFVPFIDRTFSASRILYFAPYFFGGVMLQNVKVMELVKTRVHASASWVILAIAFIGCIVASYFNVNSQMEDVFRGCYPYPIDNQWLFMLFRFLSFIVSFFVSVAIVRLFAVPNEKLEIVGKDSLKYYMFQGFALIACGYLHLPWNFVLATIYAIVATIVIWFFNKTKLSDIVLRPVHYVVSQIKSRNSKK